MSSESDSTRRPKMKLISSMLPWKNTSLVNTKELLLSLQLRKNQRKKRRNNQHTQLKSSQTLLLMKPQSSLLQRSLKLHQQRLRQLKQYLLATLSKLSPQRLKNLPKGKVKLMVHLRTLMPLQRSSQELLPRSVLFTEAERPDRMLLRRESKELRQTPSRSSKHPQKKPKLKSQLRVKSRK